MNNIAREENGGSSVYARVTNSMKLAARNGEVERSRACQ